MRIFGSLYDAVREVERDLYELGINVHPQTMQDKHIANDPDYMTKEVRAYGFQLNQWTWQPLEVERVLKYVLGEVTPGNDFLEYVYAEHADRYEKPEESNPGESWKTRSEVWSQFLYEGRFAYTYSERIRPQLTRIFNELRERPDTRQAIINIHSNIRPHKSSVIGAGPVFGSADLQNMGGSGRIPCSMYYQLMVREGRLDLIYTMRSCDFLTHFPIDLALALRFQSWACDRLGKKPGMFTYFTGSLHAYAKDMKKRSIF